MMKRIASVKFAGLVLTGILVALVGAQAQTLASQPAPATPSQSLADYARSVRKDKKAEAPKVFDNDNLPTQDKLSVVGNATEAAAAVPPADASTTQPADSSKPAAIKPGDSKEDRQKVFDEWKGKIDEQKDDINLVSRELDVLQREYRLRAAAFYADAGNRMRDSKDWDKEDTQYKQQIADKQKAVDEAKQKLDDLQEDARKAGVPTTSRE
jgi:hypothetical protein